MEITVSGKPFIDRATKRMINAIKVIPNGELLTVAEISAQTSVCTRWIRECAASGKLSEYTHKYDGRHYFGNPTTIKTFKKKLNENR